MQIKINAGHRIDVHDILTAQVDSAIESALSQHRDHITRVEVHLKDESSHNLSLNNMCCVIEARLEGRRPIVVTHRATELDQAVDGAADKLTRLIEHSLGRIYDR